MLCKDKQQSNKHRRKGDAPYPQDLTACENAAQDSKVVKKRELGTLEMTQIEQQKTPPPEPPFPAGCLFAETHHASAISRPGSLVSEYLASRPRRWSDSSFRS